MDDRSKEIRRILTGFITYEMNGAVITAAKNLLELQSSDIYSGSDNARLFGLRVETRQYMISGKIPVVHEECAKAFAGLGRRVFLYTAPEALAMLCLPIGRKPLVVTLEAKENQLLLSIYTAKAIFARSNIRKMFERLDEALPKELTKTDVTMEAPGKEHKEKKPKEKRSKPEKQTETNTRAKASKGGKRVLKK